VFDDLFCIHFGPMIVSTARFQDVLMMSLRLYPLIIVHAARFLDVCDDICYIRSDPMMVSTARF